jgi:hypothetical protein
VDCTAPAVRDWEGRQDLGGCGGCGARDERGARQPSAAGVCDDPNPSTPPSLLPACGWIQNGRRAIAETACGNGGWPCYRGEQVTLRVSDMRVTAWQQLDSLSAASEAEEIEFNTAHQAWSWCRKFAYAYTEGRAHIGQVATHCSTGSRSSDGSC